MEDELMTFDQWLAVVCSSCRKARADDGYRTCYSCRDRVAKAKGREKAPEPQIEVILVSEAGGEEAYLQRMLADLGIQEGEEDENENLP